MNVAYDIFAETNPAFCTFGLIGFCRKYKVVSGKSPQLALTYLALPLALSDDLEASFEKTNAATGLLSWLNRFPDVRLDLNARLDASKTIVSAAVRFGLSTRALSLSTDGTIGLGSGVPPTSTTDALLNNPKRVLKRAERLGTWMGKAGSTGTIFSALGVMP